MTKKFLVKTRHSGNSMVVLIPIEIRELNNIKYGDHLEIEIISHITSEKTKGPEEHLSITHEPPLKNPRSSGLILKNLKQFENKKRMKR